MSDYFILLVSTKMYHDLREVLQWVGMKKDVEKFIAKSPYCQQVKPEHQKPGCLLQQIQVLTLKWEDINMNFVVGLPWTQKQ